MFEKGKRFLIIFLIPLTLSAQGEKAEISRIGFDQVRTVGFTLDKEAKININGIAAGGDKEIKRVHNYQEDPYNLFAYAWIINAATRQMVWRVTIDGSESDWWEKSNRKFNTQINLPAGEYELYYSAVEPTVQSGFMTMGRILDKVFGDDKWEEHSRKWIVSVDNVSASLSEKAVKNYQQALSESAVISIIGAGDGSYLSRSFSLTQAVEVDIYSIGEGWKGEMFDYGWLIDANSREKIWQMRFNETEHAGGAIKNRVLRQRLKLKQGDYILYYKTDDSHSSEEWNSNPPYDPGFWGITLFAKEGIFDRNILKEFKSSKSIVSLTGIGDNAYEEEGLIVEKSGNFRIYAIGEGRNGKMYDYGWITDATTGNRIWNMDYYETVHAGGSSKNREIDQVIELNKGNYIIHYKTDGSHSYEDWNSTPPRNPETWGITVYPVGNDINVKKVNPKSLKSENIIAELTRVRDDEHLRYRFTIEEPTKIRIKAIGEGDWDEMFDYGWIVNENTGHKVWVMRYRNTDHAGGAKKNRLVDTIITLEPAIYTVHYISDDSHSYNNWNMSAPYEEKNWGITIYRVDN
jgi:hypothetical protein